MLFFRWNPGLIAGSILLLILSIPVYSAADLPSWVSNRIHPDYHPSLFLLGVGSGDSPEKACENARAEVASQISVNVKSKIKTFSFSMETEDKSLFLSDIEQKTKSRVERTVEGVVNVASHEENGVFYCLAVLEKKTLSKKLASELDMLWSKIDGLKGKSKELLTEGRLGNAIISLMEADGLEKETVSTSLIHDIFSPVPYPRDHPTGLEATISKILRNVKIKKTGRGSMRSKVGSRLADPLEVVVWMDFGNGKEIPVSGIKVRFCYNPGDCAGDALTGDTGAAVFNPVIRRGENAGSDITVITAEVVLSILPGKFKADLDASTNFEILISGPPAAIAIAARENDGKRDKDLEKHLDQLVRDLGYLPASGSKWRLKAGSEVENLKRTESFRGSRFTLTFLVTLRLEDTETGETYGLLETRSTGIGGSEEEAKGKASSRLKISRQELAELLAVMNRKG